MSATEVFCCIDPLLCGASERDRHAARAAHLSAGPGDGVGIGELERRDPFEEDLEGDLDLHAVEVGAARPVDAGAEREVEVIGLAGLYTVGFTGHLGYAGRWKGVEKGKEGV